MVVFPFTHENGSRTKKENSDIYIYLILTSSELSAIKIINDAKEKGKYIQLVGGLGVE
jgi:hypothetical protein